MKNANIPIFIPHLGCPFDCIFCNQKKIAGKIKSPTIDEVNSIIKGGLLSLGKNSVNAQIAFFGGSFTAIPKESMISYLKTAYKYVKNGSFSGIRISTRPDFIDDEILLLLKEYGVNSIELGVQSMSDEILKLNNRGHSSIDVTLASKKIKEYGFELTLQMMCFLYGSKEDDIYNTAEEIIKLEPNCTRIYPTIVIKNTFLETLYNEKKYKAPSIEKAVEVCSRIYKMFLDENIKVLRIGLFSEEGLSSGEDIVAGPFHPSFGELCESYLYKDIIDENLENYIDRKNLSLEISCKKGSISKIIGNKKSNKTYFMNKYNLNKFKVVEDERLKEYEVKIKTIN